VDSVKRLYGIYRGVVKDTKDPDKQRRLKVSIPQVSGTEVSEWAWPMEPSSINTDVPVIGQGVWISFIGGDPDYPVWYGAFGKNQGKNKKMFIKPLDNKTSLTGITDVIKINSKTDGTKDLDLTDSLIAIAQKEKSLQTTLNNLQGTVAGLVAGTGVQGTQGTRGPQGLQGSQGTIGAGTQGTAGAAGTQGTTGATGTAGSQGTQGATGAGTQGVQGTTGTQGTLGTQGATGAGAQGAQGTTGSNGTQGTQGTTGDGTQGTQGITGSNGTQGVQGTVGTQGTTGTQGATGSTGTQGSTGTTGAQGTIGSTGTQGTTGTQGSTGTTGSQGSTGSQGTQGVQGTTGTGTQGATGTQGISGATASAPLTLTQASNNASYPLTISSANQQGGGTGYADILKVTNTVAGTTNPSKFIRLNSTGGLEVVNNAYTATTLSLSDGGALSTSGAISPGAYTAGQIVKGTIWSAADMGFTTNYTQSTATYSTIASKSYTPGSASSYIFFEVYAAYEVGGGGADSFFSQLTWNNIEIGYQREVWTNASGGGSRSSKLFPLTGRVTNSGGTFTLAINARRDSSDDTLTVKADGSFYVKITEIAR
jgi:hypothetical protein